MERDINLANQAIRNAMLALQRGDKASARQWAERAASLAPDLEQPWLILGAAASPRASIAYLEKALTINPDSVPAQQGLIWARKRLAQTSSRPVPIRSQPDPSSFRDDTTSSPAPAVPVQPAQLKKASRAPARRALWLAFAIVSILVIVTWFIWSGNASPAFAMIRSDNSAPENSYSAPVDIAKPTYTPSLTLTFTSTVTPPPTSTPTDTPTLTPTDPPTFTPTLIPTDTPTITPTSVDTATPFLPDTSTPEPTLAYGQKRIVIYISQQHLYAYEGDVLVYSFVASTGMNNSTRVGTFSVLDKIPNAYGATWNIWMPNWLGIYYSGYLENGIHALPILSNGNRLWAGYLGRPISYGCIVLGVEESQLLYDWAEIGTVVEIWP
jgi:lipoprotein-anchoring transpeptidase ErfK/SrfK